MSVVSLLLGNVTYWNRRKSIPICIRNAAILLLTKQLLSETKYWAFETVIRASARRSGIV